MAEPPAKRPRRVDSSTMWEKNDIQTRSTEPGPEQDRQPRRSPHPREARRDAPREGRRYRSRSRDRKNQRRERSWSRDRRDNDRDRRDRDGRGGGRDRKRSTSRERAYDRRGPGKGDKVRDRSRSRSPARNGTRARSTTRTPPPRGYKGDRRGDRRELRSHEDGRQANGAPAGSGRYKEEMELDFKEDADEDEMETLMRKSMGFTRFRSTKNTKIPGNDIYGVRKEKKIQYRQYMNRQGGFNRPLSPSRQ
ncbi:hypothetical protein N7474_002960 [Penicillium riverlandense]|uniref:uncharacterized protein n=1 Tax=Penicillium riverlandense TaxID=1903569 RepID=UPI002548D30B|nr:uncharacterized protein N7474_002960 [Penicillium riverlandense]KAJ5825822.1 hypothetical protein N7474_002960 [Penicillium riverlandense]